MGPIGCPETSVINYHYSLSNEPEERSFHAAASPFSKFGHIRKVTNNMAGGGVGTNGPWVLGAVIYEAV